MSGNCSYALLYDAQDAINNSKSFINGSSYNSCGSLGNCNDIYNGFVNKTETDASFNMKLNNASIEDVKSFIKYNLAEYADGKIKKMGKLSLSEFGTIQWINSNIINYSDPMQLIVYILSLLIFIVIFVFSIFKIFKLLASAMDTKLLIAFIIVVSIVSIILLVFIYYYTFSTNPSIILPKTLPADATTYIDYYKQQGVNNVGVSSESRQVSFLFVYLGFLALLIAGFILMRLNISNSIVGSWATGIITIGILAYVIVSNLYYAMFIPQIIIVLIIVQLFISRLSYIPKRILSIIIIAIFLIYGIIQSFRNVPEEIEKCYNINECNKVKQVNEINMVFMIFFILVIINFAIIGFSDMPLHFDLLFAPIFYKFLPS